MVRRRRGGTVGNFCRRSAGDVFLMSRVIGVTHFDGNGLASVARLDGVGLSGADFLTVGQPAVGDTVCRYAVGVRDGCGQGFAHLRLAADDHAAGLILSGLGIGIR